MKNAIIGILMIASTCATTVLAGEFVSCGNVKTYSGCGFKNPDPRICDNDMYTMILNVTETNVSSNHLYMGKSLDLDYNRNLTKAVHVGNFICVKHDEHLLVTEFIDLSK